MPRRKPTVVFVLSEKSWARWLPPFLQHEAFSTELCWGVTTEDPRTEAHLLVPFSVHETLLENARMASTIRASRSGRIIHASVEVAGLAHDKRSMAELANRVSSCLAIKEFDFAAAEQYLACQNESAVVLKLTGDTEGRGMCIFRSVKELHAGVPSCGNARQYILQPFLSGLEYSVNIVRQDGKHLVFEPVYKGSTSLTGVHPCQRLRYCPCPYLNATDRRRLTDAAVDYAVAAGVEGLAEIELILAENAVHLLEINPRLSATMRMASVACNRSIFAEVPLAQLLPEWPYQQPQPCCFTAELPIPVNADISSLERLRFPVWLSSRVTTWAPHRGALDDQLRQLAHLLCLPHNPAEPVSYQT